MRQDFAFLLVHLVSVDASSIHLRPCQPGHVMTLCATVLPHCGGAIKHGHRRGDSKNVRGCAHGSGPGAALTAVASAKAGATASAAIRVTWAADAAISQRMAAPEHGRIRESRNFHDRRKFNGLMSVRRRGKRDEDSGRTQIVSTSAILSGKTRRGGQRQLREGKCCAAIWPCPWRPEQRQLFGA